MIRAVCEKLKDAPRISILMHRRPDGDAVGSATALGEALCMLGKKVTLHCSDPIGDKYCHLLTDGTPMGDTVEGLVVCVDLATPEMAETFSEAASAADIVIDHHASNKGYGALCLVRPEAASCTEVLYDIITELGVFSPAIALSLYVGLATDSGCFKYENTTAHTHLVAAKVMQEGGLSVGEINRKLFIEMTPAEFAIRAMAQENITSFADGKVQIMFLTREMMQKAGAGDSEMESLPSLPMQIAGTVVSACVKENADEKYKVSMRSDGSVDVSALCALFGGGGHKAAAGCTLSGTPEAVLQQLKDAMLSAVVER